MAWENDANCCRTESHIHIIEQHNQKYQDIS